MGRKKKPDKYDREYIPEPIPMIDNPYIHHITTAHPYTITTTTSDGRSGYYVYPASLTPASTISINSSVLKAHDWKDYSAIEKEIIDSMNIVSKTPAKGVYVVTCENRDDLLAENILKTLSAIKGKLMLDIAPVHIQKMECSMTPAVRRNILIASKRLKMYGKNRPIIARFDDYGNRLPDTIELNMENGVLLNIVDPDYYGVYYLELKAKEFSNDYKPTDCLPDDLTAWWPEDLPF